MGQVENRQEGADREIEAALTKGGSVTVRQWPSEAVEAASALKGGQDNCDT